MSDRKTVANEDRMVAWMRQIQDDVNMLKTRRLQGAMQMESLDVGDLSATKIEAGSVTVGGNVDEAISLASIAAGNYLQFARCPSGLTVSTTITDVPGCQIYPTKPGLYAAYAIWDVTIGTPGNSTMTGIFTATSGTLLATQGLYLIAVGGPVSHATIASFATWQVTKGMVKSADSIRLQASQNVVLAGMTLGPQTGIMLWRAKP